MEIVGIQTITEIPEMPDYIKGILNLRGKIIPVMDVRLRFHKNPREYDDRTCVIITNIADVLVGLVVDSVSEVITIDNITIRPNISNDNIIGFIPNIGLKDKTVILLIDCSKFLGDIFNNNYF